MLKEYQQDPVQKAQVIHAYARSISTIWIVMTPVVGACFIMGKCICMLHTGDISQTLHLVLGLRKYSLQRNIVRQGAKQGDNGKLESNLDVEKGSGDGVGENVSDEDVKAADEKVREESAQGVVKDSNETIGSKTVEEALARPGTGTTLGVNDGGSHRQE